MFKSLASVALFAAQVLAAVQFNDAPRNVQAGQTYTFSFSATGSGPITILLKQGADTNLQTVATIATVQSGTTASWTAPATYANGAYAFEIVQGTDRNYWGGVTYSGGSGAAVSAIPSAAVSSAAALPSSAAAAASSHAISSAAGNRTSTANTLSTRSSSTGSSTRSSTSATATIASSNSAVALGSPIALVLGALAAMLYLQ